jgi:hypothetical protein
VARLHERVILDGTPVPALLHAPGATPPADPAYIRILLFDVRYSDTRTTPMRSRSDAASGGFQLRPRSFAYDLVYQLDAFAPDRAGQVLLLELILRELTPYGALLVNGVLVPIETMTLPAIELLGGERSERPGLLWKVLARQEIGTPEAVKGVTEVLVETDVKS